VADSDNSPPSAILIAHTAIEPILADAARYAGRSERGGIFLGLRRGPHLEIKEATLPTRWDRGTMFAFHRAAAGHRAVALQRWRKSGRVMDWVGEWHSHPERFPSPSSIDLRNWQQITKSRSDQMAFLIVGYEGLWLGLCRPNRLKPIRYVEAERSDAGIAFLPQ